MREPRLASRYAKSLLNLALEQGKLEEVYGDMNLLLNTTNENHDLVILLRSPVVKTNKKLTILREIFKSHFNDLSIAFVDIITRKKREAYLMAIARAFVNQYKRHKDILTAIITTTDGLDEKLRTKVMELVKNNSDSKQVELVEKIDKDIIGGFVLTIGDRQVDASIRHKLSELKKSFKENPFVKDF